MWGDHFLASLSIPHHIYTPVRTGLAFLFLHLPRNDTISRILRMRIRRHIFLHRRVCCKCSFCQHRSGFCNYSTDRLKSWIWVNSMFYIFSFIRKIKEKITLFITPILKSLMVPVIWLALTDVIYSRIAPFFALNQIFFSSQKISKAFEIYDTLRKELQEEEFDKVKNECHCNLPFFKLTKPCPI